MNRLKLEKQDTSHMGNTYKVYYVWVGHKELPEKLKRYIDTWSKIKDAEIIQIGNECESIDTPFMRWAWGVENWCAISNYMRMYALYNWGGVYMDTDVEVVRDSYVWRDEGVQFAQEMPNWLNSHVMISHRKGHHIFEYMLKKLDAFDYPSDTYLEIETGPRLITRAIEAKGYEMKHIDQPVMYKGITIHPETTFSPHRWNKAYHPSEIKSDTLAVHHFTKLW